MSKPSALVGLVMIAFALIGCQSPSHTYFEGVRVGMDKSDVLEAAGSPTRTRRSHGLDKWEYEYRYHPEGPQVREVQFENGKATYVGSKVEPKTNAEERDRLNAKREEDDKQRERLERDRYDKEFGVARVSADGVRPPMDEYDRKIREYYSGTVDEDAERQKRAPRFVPID